MEQKFLINEKGKKFGILHPSGLNRSQRRREEALKRKNKNGRRNKN